MSQNSVSHGNGVSAESLLNIDIITGTGEMLSTGSSGIRPEIPPHYIIEIIPDPTPGLNASSQATLYRVTAMGFGPRKETQAVVQMIFRKE